MIVKIGTNAGTVYNALIDGEKTLKEIKKATKLTDKDLYAALGWLGREGNINIIESEVDVCVKLV